MCSPASLCINSVQKATINFCKAKSMVDLQFFRLRHNHTLLWWEIPAKQKFCLHHLPAPAQLCCPCWSPTTLNTCWRAEENAVDTNQSCKQACMSKINLLTDLLFTIFPRSYSSAAGRLPLQPWFSQYIYQMAAYVSQTGTEQRIVQKTFWKKYNPRENLTVFYVGVGDEQMQFILLLNKLFQSIVWKIKNVNLVYCLVSPLG